MNNNFLIAFFVTICVLALFFLISLAVIVFVYRTEIQFLFLIINVVKDIYKLIFKRDKSPELKKDKPKQPYKGDNVEDAEFTEIRNK